MKSNVFFNLLRLFILVAPLLYCGMGRLFSPLFFALLSVFIWFGFRQPRYETRYPLDRVIKWLMWAVPLLPLLQVIPLPMFLLRFVSPNTVSTLKMITTGLPSFHPISLVPFETLIFAFQVAVLVLFFRMVTGLKWGVSHWAALMRSMVYAAILLLTVGLAKWIPADIGKESQHFSFFLVMVVPVAPALLLTALGLFRIRYNMTMELLKGFFRERRAILFLGFSAALVAGVLHIASDSTQLVFSLGFLIFFLWIIFFKLSRSLRRHLFLVLVVVSLVVTFMALQPTVKDMLKYRGAQAGSGVKWQQTVGMIDSFPLMGTGFGTWKSIELLFTKSEELQWPPYLNNGYLGLLAEGGFLCTTPILILAVLLVFSIIRAARKRKHPQVKMLMLGIISAIFSASLHFIFNAALLVPYNAMIMVLLFALGVKIANKDETVKEGGKK